MPASLRGGHFCRICVTLGVMAREVITRMTDDLDRSKLADVTRELGYEGVIHILDLTHQNDEKLSKMLQPWLVAAHEKKRMSGRRRPRDGTVTAVNKASKAQRDSIRGWARDNGYVLNDRGYIPKRVVEAYKSAHDGALTGKVSHGKSTV